jgi:hypothetical protein
VFRPENREITENDEGHQHNHDISNNGDWSNWTQVDL